MGLQQLKSHQAAAIRRPAQRSLLAPTDCIRHTAAWLYGVVRRKYPAVASFAYRGGTLSSFEVQGRPCCLALCGEIQITGAVISTPGGAVGAGSPVAIDARKSDRARGGSS